MKQKGLARADGTKQKSNKASQHVARAEFEITRAEYSYYINVPKI
jgi:hypothetical protein